MSKLHADSFKVTPGKKVHLNQISPDPDKKYGLDKKQSEEDIKDLLDCLDELQNVLYASHTSKVLIILQGIDTAGKDGVIRQVFKVLNPQGVRVVGFKIPSPQELDHEYLWRAHKETPSKGEIVIFNRSYYEDVLAVRVHKLVDKEDWQKRYRQINDFERMMTEEGTLVLKFFLHIDKDEQKERLQARLDDPSKNWKFSAADLKERALWDQHIEAFNDILTKCSTPYAPWYIIPSNKKWFRDFVVSRIMVDALKNLNLSYPKAEKNIKGLVIK